MTIDINKELKEEAKSTNPNSLEQNKEDNNQDQSQTQQTKTKALNETVDTLKKASLLADSFSNTVGAIKSLVIIVVILAVGFWGYKFINTKVVEEVKITSSLVGDYLQKSQDLVSYKYFYTNAAMLENNKNLYGYNLPFTSKRLIVSYKGKATLGLDLAQLKIEVDGKKIIISNVDNVSILTHEIDDASLKIFDEETSLFSDWKISDYQGFFADQRKEVEKQIKESNIIEEARKSAKEAIKNLLNLHSQIEKEYEIIFK